MQFLLTFSWPILLQFFLCWKRDYARLYEERPLESRWVYLIVHGIFSRHRYLYLSTPNFSELFYYFFLSFFLNKIKELNYNNFQPFWMVIYFSHCVVLYYQTNTVTTNSTNVRTSYIQQANYSNRTKYCDNNIMHETIDVQWRGRDGFNTILLPR